MAVHSVNSAVSMAELASDVASFVFLLPPPLRGFAVFLFQGGCGMQGGLEVKNKTSQREGSFPLLFLFFFFAFDLTRYFVRIPSR